MKLIETSKDDYNLHFWLEPILGGALSEHLRAHGYFDVETVRLYAAQLICAMAHMNERGCMHRDIKASNCLLGQNGHIKLCDFSSAKSYDLSVSSRPIATTVIGTVEFMSPEMVARTGYSFGTDMWSIGVLLYELLTSRRPFESDIASIKALLTREQAEQNETGTTFVDLFFADRNIEFDDDCFHFSELGRQAANFLKTKLFVHEIDRIKLNNSPQDFSHDFFDGIEWSSVSTGCAPPISFDRSIGFFDVVESHSSKKGSSEIDYGGTFDGF
jgi:serine/threonine protein kinase